MATFAISMHTCTHHATHAHVSNTVACLCPISIFGVVQKPFFDHSRQPCLALASQAMWKKCSMHMQRASLSPPVNKNNVLSYFSMASSHTLLELMPDFNPMTKCSTCSWTCILCSIGQVLLAGGVQQLTTKVGQPIGITSETCLPSHQWMRSPGRLSKMRLCTWVFCFHLFWVWVKELIKVLLRLPPILNNNSAKTSWQVVHAMGQYHKPCMFGLEVSPPWADHYRAEVWTLCTGQSTCQMWQAHL